MALTRSALREKGITEKEILDYIMEEHGNTVESAKEKAKETAEAAAKITIDKLQAKVDSLPEPSTDGEDWKAKYDAEVIAHEATKTTYETEKANAAKRATYRQTLKDMGACEEDLDAFLLDKVDGDISDAKYCESFKEKYKRYFGDTVTVGADVAKPPKGEGGNNFIAQLEAARKANDTTAAVKIKTEAAKEGVILI